MDDRIDPRDLRWDHAKHRAHEMVNRALDRYDPLKAVRLRTELAGLVEAFETAIAEELYEDWCDVEEEHHA